MTEGAAPSATRFQLCALLLLVSSTTVLCESVSSIITKMWERERSCDINIHKAALFVFGDSLYDPGNNNYISTTNTNFQAKYPNKPPSVHYKSFVRTNPNFINRNFTGTGKVCLSFLNTTSGPSWQPNVSTVLQVLVSIQGLVLNEDPYINLSIFMTNTYSNSKSKNSNSMSKEYSDNVFALSCQTMIQLLRRPPLNFEEFVVEHFRDRGRCILTACKAYMNGYVRVGKYQDCESLVCDRKVKVSTTYLSLMTKIYSILFNLFVKNDPSLNDFRVQLNELMEKTETEYVEKAKLKEKKSVSRFSGIVKKVVVHIEQMCSRQHRLVLQTVPLPEESR